MLGLIWWLLLLQLALPLSVVLGNGLVPVASRVGLVLRALAVALALVLLALIGVWLVPPWWMPWALGLLHALLVLRAWRRPPLCGPTLRRAEAGLALAAIVGLAVLLAGPLGGRRAPDVARDLAMPLGPGRYLVTSGGSDAAINAHFMTLGQEFAHVVGQSHAVDIVAIDRWGRRARGLAPVDPAAYLIHGTLILAPCAGTVLATMDGLPDNRVPETDRTHLAGNHVLLECGPHAVLLAHMAPGSVAVAAGEEVTVGQRLGTVGNSGNTAAPHLHIHLQERAGPGAPALSGRPLWFTVEGRFLVRGQRLVVGP